MADSHANELAKMLRRQSLAVDVRTDHTTEHATAGGEGRTDSIATFPSGTVFIEVKAGDDSWTTRYEDPKRGWTLKQRAYAKWVEEELRHEVYICLFVGPNPPNYDPDKYKPRKAYLIPFREALEVVERVEMEGINSIPYSLNINSRRFLKENRISCLSSFAEWELSWGGSHLGWLCPMKHIFWGTYLRNSTTPNEKPSDFYEDHFEGGYIASSKVSDD